MTTAPVVWLTLIVKAEGLKPKSTPEETASNTLVKPRMDGGQWRNIRLLTSRITALEAAQEAMRLKLNRIERKVYRDEAKIEENPPSTINANNGDLDMVRVLSPAEVSAIMRGA